jgi:hypothetical protein
MVIQAAEDLRGSALESHGSGRGVEAGRLPVLHRNLRVCDGDRPAEHDRPRRARRAGRAHREPGDGGKATVTTEPVKCPGITSATFTSSSATFSNVSDPVDPASGYQWSSTESWNVAFTQTALSVGSYAVGTVVASGGAFTTTRRMNPTCTGSLSLTTADSPKDPWLKVLSDEGAGTDRHWRVSLTPPRPTATSS